MGKTAAIITLQTRSTGRKGQRDKHGNSGWPQYTLKHTERERGRSLHKTHESECVHNWFLCPHPYPATHPLFLLSAIIKNTFMPVITHSLVQQTDHSLFYHQSTILYFFFTLHFWNCSLPLLLLCYYWCLFLLSRNTKHIRILSSTFQPHVPLYIGPVLCAGLTMTVLFQPMIKAHISECIFL